VPMRLQFDNHHSPCFLPQAVALLALRALLALSILGLAGLAGCARFTPAGKHHVAKSPLQPATPSPDSVSLEIIFARLQQDSTQEAQQLWQWVDEQQLPAELRRRLMQDGLRAGVLGSHLPPELVAALELSDAYEAKAKATDGEEAALQGVQVDREVSVTRRLLQLRAGKRGEVLASPVLAEMPLIRRVEGCVCGESFERAQCLFAVVPQVTAAGRVDLQLTPEVHYGEPQRQWTGSEGMFRLVMSRPKKVLDDLQIETTLSAGQILLVTSLPDRPGSLGDYFFTEPSTDGPHRKLLLLRLASRPPSALEVPRPEPLDLAAPKE